LAGRLRRSDLNLFRNQKGVVDINPKIPNCALNLRMAKQKLNGPEIACSPIDHRGFGSPQGMGTVGEGIKGLCCTDRLVNALRPPHIFA
jgi:hypothetical protein